MKRLFLFVLLAVFLFSCDKEDDKTEELWNQNLVGLSFTGHKPPYEQKITFAFLTENKVTIFDYPYDEKIERIIFDYTYVKEARPDGSLWVGIEEIAKENGKTYYMFTGIIDPYGKVLSSTYDGTPVGVLIPINPLLQHLKPDTKFYREGK